MKPVLYGIGISVFVRKVRYLLQFKGIDYNHVQVNPVDPPEGFRKLSPIGKIPALKHGDFTVSDSSIICQYLEKVYPEKALLPDCPEAFAKSLWFDEYSDTKMTQTITTIFFERFGRPQLFNQPSDEGKIAEVEKLVPDVLDYLETSLQGKEFLTGDKISLGDLGVISQLYNYILCGYVIDPARWPSVDRYLQKSLKLPFIEAVNLKERKEFPL